MAACDRHTHQARVNSRREPFELWKPETWYVPFEIHAVLRLRELNGLKNPSLQHPLLATPIGPLPAVAPVYTDPMLQAATARIGRELPEFAQL